MRLLNRVKQIFISWFPLSREIGLNLIFFLWCYPKYMLLYLMRKYRYKEVVDPAETDRYITYTPTGEGIGGLMVRFVAAKALAHYFSLTYAHTAFPTSFHYTCDFDTFLGFGIRDVNCNDLLADSDLEIINLPEFDLSHFRKSKLFLIGLIVNSASNKKKRLFKVSGFSNSELHILDKEYNEKLFRDLKKNYMEARLSHPVESPFDEEKIKTAVHVRRSEISTFKEKNNPTGLLRWRSNEWYISVLNKINEQYSAEKVDIHLFSDEENIKELEEFEKIPNLTFHIKKDDPFQPLKAFHAAVVSDITVGSISGFSIESARLSDGIKIFPTSKLGFEHVFTGKNWMHVNAGNECNFEKAGQ